jgi:hypothetical protein
LYSILTPSYSAFKIYAFLALPDIYVYFAKYQGLTVKEMEELRDDIKMHLDLDRESQTNVKYWEVHVIFFHLFTE